MLIETDEWVLLYDADTELGIVRNNIDALGISLMGG